MMLLNHVNLISVFLIGVFLLPVVIGLLRPLTVERIYSSFNTTLSAAAVIGSVALSLFVADSLFSNGGDNPLGRLFSGIPAIWISLVSQDIFVYLLVFFILLIGLNSAFQLLLIPLNKKVLYPLSLRLGRAVGSMRRLFGRLLGGLWQLPKSLWLVLVFALLFNFYALVSKNTTLDEYINSSMPYRLLDDGAIQPIISSEAARQIPAIVDKTVDKAIECLSPEGRKLLIKVYINGTTVDDAVVSSPDIDNLAIDLVDAETDRIAMARVLYDWVTESISYDTEKAKMLETDAFGVSSGAVVAFSEKTGVCYDKACLYAAMCRAVGIRVRLITGYAFNGSEWLDHSWNEIYDDTGDRWLNVDTTFGSKYRSYFDSPGFMDDHKDAEIQGEW
jgi:hypothetical protein